MAEEGHSFLHFLPSTKWKLYCHSTTELVTATPLAQNPPSFLHCKSLAPRLNNPPLWSPYLSLGDSRMGAPMMTFTKC